MDKTYLGDGAYVEVVDYGIRLTTENGISVTNEVFLEPEVLQAFLDYLKFVGVVKA